MSRPRGRPRQYDPDKALEAAMTVFWERGFASTSLDELCEATGMNRPSLYAAFGDKRSMYLQALQRFGERMSEDMGGALASESDLYSALTAFYFRAIDVYLSGDPGHRGCMIVSTASVETARDEEIRGRLAWTIERLDAALGERFRRAAAEGTLAPGDVGPRGRLATAILHSLSVRARAGQGRRVLRKLAKDGAALLAGGPPDA